MGSDATPKSRPVYHACHHPGCPRQVAPAKLACLQHWFALPPKMRDAVWREYRVGQEQTKQPSFRYMAVQRLCMVYWLFKPNDEMAARACVVPLAEAKYYRSRAMARGQGDPFRGLVADECLDTPVADAFGAVAQGEARPSNDVPGGNTPDGNTPNGNGTR